MRDLEKDIAIGQAVKDTIQTDGWQYIKKRIEEEIKDEEIAFREVEKKDAFTMLTEFIDHQKTMQGLERIFIIIEEFISEKEGAENKLRDEK